MQQCEDDTMDNLSLICKTNKQKRKEENLCGLKNDFTPSLNSIAKFVNTNKASEMKENRNSQKASSD